MRPSFLVVTHLAIRLFVNSSNLGLGRVITRNRGQVRYGPSVQQLEHSQAVVHTLPHLQFLMRVENQRLLIVVSIGTDGASRAVGFGYDFEDLLIGQSVLGASRIADVMNCRNGDFDPAHGYLRPSLS